MLKKLGIPTLAIAAMLGLAGAAPAKAGIHFGIGIGGPAYVAPYANPYPYAATPYDPYAYAAPYADPYAYGGYADPYYYSTPYPYGGFYYGGHDFDHFGGHRDFRGHEGGHFEGGGHFGGGHAGGHGGGRR
jgi:hypothetical protein